MSAMPRHMGVRTELFPCHLEVDIVCRRLHNGKLMIEKKKKGCVWGVDLKRTMSVTELTLSSQAFYEGKYIF